MDKDLLQEITSELLKKFGAGKGSPGSGSAAAFHGLLSSQLLITIIDITNRPSLQGAHSTHLAEMLELKQEIKDRIYPRLQELFQQDSDQFDITIEYLKKRKGATGITSKQELNAAYLESLKASTKIPVEIAKLAVELAEMGCFVFDHGYKDVRGDSQVAISSSISCLKSCLSIIRLNLNNFDSSYTKIYYYYEFNLQATKRRVN